jgi:hypothetical protein
MKIKINFLIITLIVLFYSIDALSQKRPSSEDFITASGIESHMSFLASPLLQGRMNGESGLEIAQQYIISQIKLMGLKPANGTSFLQSYYLTKTTISPEKTMIQVIPEGKDTIAVRNQIFQLLPTGPSDFTLEGEVLFAGYGLSQEKYGYSDFDNIQAEGKILLIMTGAPKTKEGKYVFEGVDWSSFLSIQIKLTSLLFSKAKAVIIVTDPKSGQLSLDELYPGVSGELSSSINMKGDSPRTFQISGAPKILFVHQTVADVLLKDTGYSLEQLQEQIDADLMPHSFIIPGKRLKITEVKQTSDLILNNVAAIIEGSDPLLRNEYVIFSGHADHIGASGGHINAGADDNASGCAALISIASAFQSLEKKPLRSILFLWVSGEEIGLYGSKSYVNDPLIPLDKTVADINIDMIGRIKGAADTTKDNPMTGPEKVFVIADNQSKDIMAIAEEVDKTSILDFDYSLSGRNHPLQLYARSDHFNFVKKDIPTLFFSSGLHTDYHTPGDVIEKIDFKKMELISRAIFQIGYNVANSKSRIVVDNPFSKW